MGIVSLEEITITNLRQIEVEGGNVMHGMKKNDIGYNGFGEAYFSWVKKDNIKAWKLHERMTLNLIVPIGRIRLVFVTQSQPENFRVEEIGSNNYSRISVPPGIWFGFMGISNQDSLLLNISNIIHDPTEVVKENLNYFKYQWIQ